MGFMSFLDPGGIGRSILNPGGVMNWAMPYLGTIGTGIGSIIGGIYGGPAGSAAGGAIGGMGGEQLGGYLSKDKAYESDPFSGPTLMKGAKTAGMGAAAGYLGSSLLSGMGGGSGATGMEGALMKNPATGMMEMAPSYGGGSASLLSDYYKNLNILNEPDAWAAYKGEGTPTLEYNTGNVPAFAGYGKELTANYEPNAWANYQGATNPYLDYGGKGIGMGTSLLTIPSPETPTTPTQSAPAGPQSKNPAQKGILQNLSGYATPQNMGLLMLGGSALDYLGSVANANALKSGQADYRNASTWTPQRTSEYMNALTNLYGGIYGNEAEQKKKSIAEMMAGAGRGGGTAGKLSERIARDRREGLARALTSGITMTSQPPNLGLGAYAAPSPGGQALTNLGGLMGTGATTLAQLAILRQLYGNGAGG